VDPIHHRGTSPSDLLSAYLAGSILLSSGSPSVQLIHTLCLLNGGTSRTANPDSTRPTPCEGEPRRYPPAIRHRISRSPTMQTSLLDHDSPDAIFRIHTVYTLVTAVSSAVRAGGQAGRHRRTSPTRSSEEMSSCVPTDTFPRSIHVRSRTSFCSGTGPPISEKNGPSSSVADCGGHHHRASKTRQAHLSKQQQQ
jgi:hypothetical protein